MEPFPLIACMLLLQLWTAAPDGVSAIGAVQGTKCAKNQVVNKITVYEDGAIEAECGPMPCGSAESTEDKCMDEQTTCRAESHTFAGMKWAPNGQSLALRCCPATVPNRIYVGTDLVTLGSYYTGGKVAKKDMYAKAGGPEYDYVVNMRTEQGGVRVWVYRIMCPPGSEQQQQLPLQGDIISTGSGVSSAEKRRAYILKQMAENNDPQPESVQSSAPAPSQISSIVDPRVEAPQEPINPLQYRPPPAVAAAGERTTRQQRVRAPNSAAEARLL